MGVTEGTATGGEAALLSHGESWGDRGEGGGMWGFPLASVASPRDGAGFPGGQLPGRSAPGAHLPPRSGPGQETVVVERWWQVPLSKEGRQPRLHPRRHRIYRLLEDTKHLPKGNLELILTQSVESTFLFTGVCCPAAQLGAPRDS